MRPAVVAAIVAIAVAAIVAIALSTTSPGKTGPGPSPSADRQTVAAPIEDVQVFFGGSNPPQVTVKVRAGLPSGCAKQDSYAVDRAGDTITVAVRNSMPTGNPICTVIYGTYELNIDLGMNFRSGATYTVRVNDKTTTFKT